MSVYVVVQFTITDDKVFEEYAAPSRATIRMHEGRVVARGEARVLHGKLEHPVGAILEFPDETSATKWFRSDEYQKLVPLRDRSSKQVFCIYPEFREQE